MLSSHLFLGLPLLITGFLDSALSDDFCDSFICLASYMYASLSRSEVKSIFALLSRDVTYNDKARSAVASAPRQQRDEIIACRRRDATDGHLSAVSNRDRNRSISLLCTYDRRRV